MDKFVHLHVHSHYSLLDGLAKIDNLLTQAQELGMDSIALTDHGNMYGAIEFYYKAKEKGIKPIIGCEIYIAPRSMLSKVAKVDTNAFHLVLLAENYQGYLNLIKLITEAHLKGYYYVPRVDKDLLKKYSQGLIALSACLGGEIPHLILANNFDRAIKKAKEYEAIFGRGNFYLELQYQKNSSDFKKVNEKLIEISQKTKIPLVATNDVHYLNKGDREAHEILLCVQTGKTLEDESHFTMKDLNLSLLSSKEMIDNFRDIPEAIKNTVKIAQRCNLELKFEKLIMPHFEVPPPYNPNSYLKALCLQGLIKRCVHKVSSDKIQNHPLVIEKINQNDIKKVDSRIIQRMEYELSVIKKVKFASYFLIVADFVNYARKNGIVVGPGRGSAAGSLVSYLLNITNIDPLNYGLLFERFLNLERIAPPDIDLDFADDRRDEVIAYVNKKYGEDHVAQIITFGTMMARNAVRDTGRALGMSYSEVDKIAKLIPMKLKLSESLEQVSELKEIYQKDEKVKRLLDMAQKLEGVVRHASTHAAGVVISKDPLINYVPLQKSTRSGTQTVTQYSMYNLEQIGLLKIDFLGLSNLTIIANTIKIIEKTHNLKLDWEKIPLNDQKTFELLSKGETVGVFQLESEGMRRCLVKLKPTDINDIIAMVALYRPGPMQWIENYIKRKYGQEEVTYQHPKLEPILKETYGIPIYQEQIIQIAKELAGFSGPEADTLRKAMGKKIVSLMKEMRTKFIKGAVKNGIDKNLAQDIFNIMEDFAAYAFNKSHSACYALIAYQTAYLKAHYPAEFMAALLTSDHGNIDRLSIEIAECERMGIKILPPSVNESFSNFTVVGDKAIRFGLAAIKNMGEGPIKAIIEARKKNKFKNLEDFLNRVPAKELNKKVLESLIKSGAMDCFGSREKMLAGLDLILKYIQRVQKEINFGQIDIFNLMGAENNFVLKLPDVAEIPLKQKLSWERELLGSYVSQHPLDLFKDYLRFKGIFCDSLTKDDVGKIIEIGGIITNIQKVFTRSSEPMLFVSLEDTTGSIEVLVFPKVYQKNPFFWQKDKIVLVKGRIAFKDGSYKLLCEDFSEITEEEIKNFRKDNKINKKNNPSRIIIKIPSNTSRNILEKINKILIKENGGDTEIILLMNNKKIKTPFKVNYSPKFEEEIKNLLKENSFRRG